MHPHAEIAAETAEFAAEYTKFWEMHDLIFENQTQLNLPLLVQLVESLKLSPEEFKAAIVNQTYAPKIKKDFLGGVKSGVNGTPTFFINERRLTGSFEFEDLVNAIDSELTSRKSAR